jgi:hypothetical protein
MVIVPQVDGKIIRANYLVNLLLMDLAPFLTVHTCILHYICQQNIELCHLFDPRRFVVDIRHGDVHINTEQ